MANNMLVGVAKDMSMEVKISYCNSSADDIAPQYHIQI